MKNPELATTFKEVKAATRKTGRPIWAALAEELDRSKRSRVSVNLSTIERHSEEGDVVAVPGKVLALGSLTHPVRVAAFSALPPAPDLSSVEDLWHYQQAGHGGADDDRPVRRVGYPHHPEYS